ncbi:hypothetical protein [Planctobacterium marinum]|uniref:hypothetical protein n=1 Tax=Planctobacterium marinum TaxID=1631968 RepID=UPI001E45470D|nr:hypothetical protein [Planctobacterium marinum]MCC2604354.1 hypothetical protein [Planctobacterium marinum]
MSWTIVFWYTSILVVVSVIGRLFDLSNGTWQQNTKGYKVQDVIDVIVVLFGLIGLFGLAFNERYFSQSLWQGYFVVTMVYIPLSFFTPKFSGMRQLYGNFNVFKAVVSNTLLMAPSHIGQYIYAFNVSWA